MPSAQISLKLANPNNYQHTISYFPPTSPTTNHHPCNPQPFPPPPSTFSQPPTSTPTSSSHPIYHILHFPLPQFLPLTHLLQPLQQLHAARDCLRGPLLRLAVGRRRSALVPARAMRGAPRWTLVTAAYFGTLFAVGFVYPLSTGETLLRTAFDTAKTLKPS